MQMRILICLSFCLLSTSLIHPATANSITRQAADLVNSTCKQCAEKSATPASTYDHCVTSLQVPPISHLVNLPGLAIIAMELALENATSTIHTVKGMIGDGGFDPFVEDCLTVCLELYQDAVESVEEAVNAFLSDHFDAAEIFMSAVMEDSVTCGEGFKEKKGELTPLLEQNENLFELSGIAVCIVKLVASSFSPLSTFSALSTQARTE